MVNIWSRNWLVSRQHQAITRTNTNWLSTSPWGSNWHSVSFVMELILTNHDAIWRHWMSHALSHNNDVRASIRWCWDNGTLIKLYTKYIISMENALSAKWQPFCKGHNVFNPDTDCTCWYLCYVSCQLPRNMIKLTHPFLGYEPQISHGCQTGNVT